MSCVGLGCRGVDSCLRRGLDIARCGGDGSVMIRKAVSNDFAVRGEICVVSREGGRADAGCGVLCRRNVMCGAWMLRR